MAVAVNVIPDISVNFSRNRLTRQCQLEWGFLAYIVVVPAELRFLQSRDLRIKLQENPATLASPQDEASVVRI